MGNLMKVIINIHMSQMGPLCLTLMSHRTNPQQAVAVPVAIAPQSQELVFQVQGQRQVWIAIEGSRDGTLRQALLN